MVDPDPFEDDEVVEDPAAVKLAAAVAPGEKLRFRVDLRDRWQHRCRALADNSDAIASFECRARAV